MRVSLVRFIPALAHDCKKDPRGKFRYCRFAVIDDPDRKWLKWIRKVQSCLVSQGIDAGMNKDV